MNHFVPLLRRPVDVVGNAIVVDDDEVTEPAAPSKRPATTDAVTDDGPVHESAPDDECVHAKRQRKDDGSAAGMSCEERDVQQVKAGIDDNDVKTEGNDAGFKDVNVVYEQLTSRSSNILSQIPRGPKSNVSYLVDNTTNVERQTSPVSSILSGTTAEFGNPVVLCADGLF